MRKILGIGGAFLLCAGLLFYQRVFALKGVVSPLETDEAQSCTIEGYEEPEAAVGYLLYQIQQQDLDAALRICAIGDVAEYFNMASYLKDTEKFEGVEFLPPPDMENQAYIEIIRNRMAYEYGNFFETCCSMIPEGHTLEILNIQINEPDNPDGMYYIRRDEISTILGARDVCEVKAYVSVDDTTYEMRFSLGRYRRFWKILQFSYLEDYPDRGPYIQNVGTEIGTFEDQWDESAAADVILPQNYYILESKGEEDPETLLRRFFLYFQRDDSLSAMSYFTSNSTDNEQKITLEQLSRQNDIAKVLQNMYYEMLLYDQNSLEWAARHYNDTPEYIPELLNTENMIFPNLDDMELMEQTDGREVWQIYYSYASRSFVRRFVLVYDDGWKIESME